MMQRFKKCFLWLLVMLGLSSERGVQNIGQESGLFMSTCYSLLFIEIFTLSNHIVSSSPLELGSLEIGLKSLLKDRRSPWDHRRPYGNRTSNFYDCDSHCWQLHSEPLHRWKDCWNSYPLDSCQDCCITIGFGIFHYSRCYIDALLLLWWFW